MGDGGGCRFGTLLCSLVSLRAGLLMALLVSESFEEVESLEALVLVDIDVSLRGLVWYVDLVSTTLLSLGTGTGLDSISTC